MNKTILRRLFWIFLLVLVVACGKQTAAVPTMTPVPLIASPAPVPTTTLAPVTITPSPLPTQPSIHLIMPDAIQLARWKEYEDALAQCILPMFPFESILCEWDILAQSDQKVYVWAVCGSSKGDDSRPALIHLEIDGSVHSVEIPKRGSSSDIDKMFPKEAQIKFSFYIGDSIFNGRLKEMYNHLIFRETHPEEPPLIVLLATPTP